MHEGTALLDSPPGIRVLLVNVPPHRMRRLLRRCRRWPRPDRKLLVSQLQVVAHLRRIALS